MGKNIQEGADFPDFSLSDKDGKVWQNTDFLGQKTVLYFYPKDNTPGCTREGHDFSNLLPEFQKNNIHLAGISTDSSKSHNGFCAKQGYEHLLLSDQEKKLTADLGILGLTGTAKRATYLLDKTGKIIKIWPEVSVAGHATEVLQTAKAS